MCVIYRLNPAGVPQETGLGTAVGTELVTGRGSAVVPDEGGGGW